MGFRRNPIRTRAQDPSARRWVPEGFLLKSTHVQPVTCSICGRKIPAGETYYLRAWLEIHSHLTCGPPPERKPAPLRPVVERAPCISAFDPWCGRTDCEHCQRFDRVPKGA
jgi:hypothetical protein